ncbi:MAG: radical SAM protein, partial [Acidobacteria bacterium]|nr:radical SAM protein [Acidobacteriota bacterium]
MRASHGWDHVDRERKREIIEAIKSGTATSGPSHLELDLTDRCNVACYFCNQQDLRTKEQIPEDTIRTTIDSLAETGLRSVRLSGGGDPLFHRQIHDVLDHLISKGIIIDNLTTNGVALSPEISRKLVSSKAREVIVSLNAPNAEQYHRMLRVKPALFDKVLENVRSLVDIRGDAEGPSIVIQIL